ncbi:hypothetical protein AOLI_G00271950 [Acnodon oligacanthus]
MAEVAPAPAAAAAPAKAPKKKRTAKPKKAGPSVGELIVKAVSQSKERSGVSLAALKKALAAGGYDVDKNKSRVKIAVKSLVTKGTLVQTKGTGASGSFKLNKKQAEPKKKVAKKAAPKAKKAAVKKPAAAKKPKKVAAKKPAAAKKSPKKAKKPAAAKKVAKSPKKAKKPAAPKKAAKSPKKAKAVKAKAAKPKAAKKAAPKKNTPAEKVIPSNVPPFISDELITQELSRFGKLVSPIKIPLGCNSPLVKHLGSFRRLVFMVLRDDEEELTAGEPAVNQPGGEEQDQGIPGPVEQDNQLRDSGTEVGLAGTAVEVEMEEETVFKVPHKRKKPDRGKGTKQAKTAVQ